MKKFIQLFFAIAIILLIMGCPKDDISEEPLKSPPQMTLYTNPTDPLLLKVETQEGVTICYYGEKDRETGEALSFDAYSVLAPGETKETIVIVDEEGKTKQIFATNGVVFKLEWLSENEIRVEAISPEGDIELSIPIDLKESLKENDIVSENYFTNIRKDKKSQFFVTPAYNEEVYNKDLKETKGSVNFTLKQCDYLVLNANINLRFDPNDILDGHYGIMKNLGNGQYKLNTPSQFGLPPVNLKPICDKLLSLLNIACAGQSALTFYDKAAICVKITAEISVVFPNVVSAAAITAVCAGAFTASELYCSFIHEDYGGGTSIDSWFCDKITSICNQPAAQYKMKAYIKVPGIKSETSNWMDYQHGSNSWTITLNPQLRIVNFKTVPKDPSPGQGYVASALILCPSAEGTEVKISVVGSDGYMNSYTTTITENSDISLYVPGAEAGVRDIITIKCTGGPKKEISIVF